MARGGTCDDCGDSIQVGWTPDGHDRDGPVVCRDCYEARDGPEKSRQRHAERRAREAVRTGRVGPGGETKPMTEADAHRAAHNRARVLENASAQGRSF